MSSILGLEDEKMEIHHITLGPVQTNCYIVGNEETKEAVIIDPADEGAYLAKRVHSLGYDLKAILLTHGHFDHMTGAEALKEASGAEIYCSQEEAKLMADPKLNCGGMAGQKVSLTPDHFFADGEKLTFAGITFEVLFTPGHTSGGVCFYVEKEKVVFSGDTLFQESVGRTDLPTGNGRRLIKSIQEKLMPLADDVVVYPGHGEETTIGYERQHNYYLK
jgi:glyoxylase-like metal-dependent hydrolase (beta-lactamase superfamily II)